MATRFYVTTPIYYINDVPHLGSAYTTIAADTLCRYKRLRGFEARFLTGTDEHGLKIQRAAEERGVSPEALATEVSEVFRSTWPKLGCEPDDFIRTSEPRHKSVVQALWSRIAEAGDIYLGHYEGLYCVGCEAYYTEKELEQPGNLCPLHKRAAETVKEESYFFRLSKYQDKLLDLYANHPEFVLPAGRRNEVRAFVQSGLEDLSISRTTFRWGVPVPGDPRHVMYVWFDALTNYFSALQGAQDTALFWEFDSEKVHLVGKDIVRFHAVYWPAFLMAAGLDLPSTIFAHGFLTYAGQKMSKTLRNTVSPVALAEALPCAFGADVLRYVLLRSISFGQDGDFSMDELLSRYTADLGNALGNLLNRTLPFAETVPAKAATTALEDELLCTCMRRANAVAEAFDAYAPTAALTALWTVIQAANLYVDKAAPWAAKKSDPARLGMIVATLLEVLGGVSVMLAPVMPKVAEAMRLQLGLPPLAPSVGSDMWPFAPPSRTVGEPLARGLPLFPRFEKSTEQELRERFAPPKAEAASVPVAVEAAAVAAPAAPTEVAAEKSPVRPTISYDDFAKIDLRVGVVISAERVKKKDRLLDLRVDVGEAEPRRIIAGIAASYSPEQVVGKRVAVLANLAPRDFGKGLVSQGMLLAADIPGGLALMTPERDAEPGSEIR
jgi:methionyl-tRNA synthetase